LTTQNSRLSAFPRLRWLAFWLLVIFVLLAAVVNWQTRQAWKEYVAEAKAKGDSFDPASVIPPPIPDAENFAMAPIFQPLFDNSMRGTPQWEVLEHLNLSGGKGFPFRQGCWPDGRLVDLAAWQKYFRERKDLPKAPQPGAPAADVLLALSKFDKEISELHREAGARPRSRFPVRYEDGIRAAMPHLSLFMRVVAIADLRAVAELSAGRSSAASEDLLLGFRLASSISEEPMCFPLSIRALIFRAAFEPMWEGLMRRQWTEEQLALFETRLAEIHLAADCRAAARGERNLEMFPDLDALERDPHRYRRLGTSNLETVVYQALVFLAPTVLIEANKVSVGQWCDRVFICTDPVKNRFLSDRIRELQMESETMEEGAGNSLGSVFAQPFAGEMFSMLLQCAEAQESVNLMRVAIALERHRLRHGDYPETIEMLDPRAASNGLPGDAATDRPVHYARTPDGRFTLYYEGWNGVDDGGKMAWQNKDHRWADFTKGDWVWPWPEP
jgi:hypothetical protein